VLRSPGGGDVPVESSADGSEDGDDVYDGTLPHRQQRSDTDSTHFGLSVCSAGVLRRQSHCH